MLLLLLLPPAPADDELTLLLVRCNKITLFDVGITCTITAFAAFIPPLDNKAFSRPLHGLNLITTLAFAFPIGCGSSSFTVHHYKCTQRTDRYYTPFFHAQKHLTQDLPYPQRSRSVYLETGLFPQSEQQMECLCSLTLSCLP